MICVCDLILKCYYQDARTLPQIFNIIYLVFSGSYFLPFLTTIPLLKNWNQ